MLSLGLGYVIEAGIGYLWLALVIILGLVVEIGFRIGAAWRRAKPKQETAGVTTLTGSMLGLVGFALALTVGFAQDRFETRRHTILDEANAIGTAWLRTDLLGESGRPIAAEIEQYARERLAYLEAATRHEAAPILARSNDRQNEIWRQTMAALGAVPAPLGASVLASLNDMFDGSMTQHYAMESRVPIQTLLMLLAGTFLALGALGYQMGLAGRRQVVLTLLMLVMFSGGMVMVSDLNRPRLGFTQVDVRPMQWTIQGFATGPAKPAN